MNEGVIVGVILLLFVFFRIWKKRKVLMENYIAGYNMICHKAGIPPYIPKRKEEKNDFINK